MAKPSGAFWWLAGRAGRREYWVWIGLLTLTGLVLSHAPPAIGFALGFGVMCAQIRRAHDLGRSGWWGVAAWVLPMLPLAPLMYLANEDVALAVGIVLELVVLVAMGALPGDPDGNRFGPPPPFTVCRVLTGR